jgi:hypothetical protein
MFIDLLSNQHSRTYHKKDSERPAAAARRWTRVGRGRQKQEQASQRAKFWRCVRGWVHAPCLRVVSCFARRRAARGCRARRDLPALVPSSFASSSGRRARGGLAALRGVRGSARPGTPPPHRQPGAAERLGPRAHAARAAGPRGPDREPTRLGPRAHAARTAGPRGSDRGPTRPGPRAHKARVAGPRGPDRGPRRPVPRAHAARRRGSEGRDPLRRRAATGPRPLRGVTRWHARPGTPPPPRQPGQALPSGSERGPTRLRHRVLPWAAAPGTLSRGRRGAAPGRGQAGEGAGARRVRLNGFTGQEWRRKVCVGRGGGGQCQWSGARGAPGARGGRAQ